MSTVGEPGVHGATATGMQGIGVNTPNAAAVAAATAGFARDWHMPKGRTLTIGLLSMILATGPPEVITLLWGITIREDGAEPKEHDSMAPLHTHIPNVFSPFFLRFQQIKLICFIQCLLAFCAWIDKNSFSIDFDH
jgi:hypothetical protein